MSVNLFFLSELAIFFSMFKREQSSMYWAIEKIQTSLGQPHVSTWRNTHTNYILQRLSSHLN